MSVKIEPIEPIDHLELRSVWPNEATDTTPLVASPEGLSHIAAATGLRLSDGKTGATVGPFHADAPASIDGSEGEIAVIENQLGSTDNDHLGKLLTYVHGLSARVGRRVAETALPEHRRVVEWLNRTVGAERSFWLLYVDRIRIGGSGVGVYFRVVVSPERRIEGVAASEKAEKKYGIAYHHDAETTWAENVQLLDEITAALSAFPDIQIRWDKQLYLKVLNAPATRELRVFDSYKKARLDLAFMHADVPEIQAVPGQAGVQAKVEPTHGYAPGSPWIGFDASLSGAATAVHSWLLASR